jgi:hypothetical protein
MIEEGKGKGERKDRDGDEEQEQDCGWWVVGRGTRLWVVGGGY